MEDTVRSFLKKYNITCQNTIIVGFSGGQDSLCLLNILKQLKNCIGYNLVAAHLNHNWRGKEALSEQNFCKDFCLSNKIIFETKTLQDGLAHTEEIARKERYQFFDETASKYPNSVIFTAHTKTDNIETILYRIIKGTGIFGLCGIPEEKTTKYKVYRPLLDFSREKVSTYCSINGLNPCNDSSNKNTKYARNKLRLDIIPLMKEINPKIEDNLQNLCEIAKNYEKIIQNIAQNEDFNPKNIKKMDSFLRKTKIHNFLTQNKIDYDFKKIEKIENFILENCNKPCGKKMSISSSKYLFCSKNVIKLIENSIIKKNINIEITKDATTVLDELGIVLDIKKESDFPKTFPQSNENTAFINLQEDKLFLRTRQEGDIIRPFGHSRPIKLKDYFIKKGIPKHQRDDILLLSDTQEVLWVIGVGISEKIKAIKKPVYKIEVRRTNE